MLAKEIAVLGRVTAAWTTMIAEVSTPDMPQSTQLCSLPPCITMLCLYKVVSCAVDILSTTPANGLGEMRMPATAVQVDLLVALAPSIALTHILWLDCAQVSQPFARSMVPLSALSQQAFASSSQGGSEALPQNAVQQREARV